MEKISIIVPVYNAEKYILRCCNSILNQSLKIIPQMAIPHTIERSIYPVVP